jgi:hypothetical protein
VTIAGKRERDPDLMAHLGTEAAYEHFSRESVRLAEEMLNRAYAVQRLAQAYPRERELRLPAKAAAQLKEMLRVHRVSARADLDKLRASLPQGMVHQATSGNSASWQQAASVFLATTQRANRALKISLGFIPGASSDSLLSQSLASADEALLTLETYTR